MYWLVAIWMSSCGVNGNYVPCTATQIVSGPISSAECTAKLAEQNESKDAYVCAQVKLDDRFAHSYEHYPYLPVIPEPEGRYQMHGNEKVYE